MTQITRWRPDTCDCVIEFEWDDSVPESEREHKWHRTVKACPHHKEQKEKHFDQVLGENRRKNRALGALLVDDPELKLDDVQWAFDDQRRLTLKCGKLKDQGKAQKAVDDAMGRGAVTVDV